MAWIAISGKLVAVCVVLVGVVAYSVVLFGAYVRNRTQWRELIDRNPGYTLGLPISAATSFAIVTLLEATAGGTFNFTAFGVKFEGPAGPVTLRLVCYLGLVLSMKWVSKLGSA